MPSCENVTFWIGVSEGGMTGTSLPVAIWRTESSQRPAVSRFRALDFGDEDRVIAGVEMSDDFALEMRERVVEQDDAAVTAAICDAVESAGVRISRETTRVRLLIR